MKIKTRFAPSPTGCLHLGSVRTALYSWLFARRYNGKFILRVEDTDLVRSKSISEKSILDGLKWLGLYWDEGPYFQTHRLKRYKEMIEIMLQKDIAYKCCCTNQELIKERNIQMLKGEKPRYNRKCRNIEKHVTFHKPYVVRFKNPLFGQVKFNDQVRGEIVFNNAELDDLIIQRSNGMPTYNFCVVIDDLDMQITHVIRGEDHINNTPRQINIFRSLGKQEPIYAHLSMILNEKGKKISKRYDAIDIIEYNKQGFLPDAILNYIIRLGWSCGDKEIFNISEMQKLFNLDAISKSSCIINMKKLLWLNKYYINHLPLVYISNAFQDFAKQKNFNIENGPNIESLIKLLKNRYHTFQELIDSCRYFYEDFKTFDIEGSKKYLIVSNIYILHACHVNFKKLSVWCSHVIFRTIVDISEKLKISIKEINMILRISLTGGMHSPNISSVVFLLGKSKTVLRLQRAINYINSCTK
ncbi:MAG: glutamate--tRNA ligase [Buchnera aphidicola (Pentalonia nigronervosa)]|jgi:glutamyl-tRNA synthetase|uniref:Glutamate--tRNA ligase n=1 Tax=Buchnera aphidicola (Pentalonia nigronervosa) TaxID=1309793 RepID=A0A7H1AZA9_9GAMM|nr:MAG: glutamate--tRNA ligase [Buchnera aphidicola (Pentalonia nigronervosa)]